MKSIPQVKSRKDVKDKYKALKALALAVLILVSIEGFLWILEENEYFGEPYLWGCQQIVAYKINHCKELFSQPEHIGKLKIVSMGDSFCVTGFNPFRFDKYFNESTITYNFGIVGSAIRSQSFYIEKVIIPQIAPDAIIWVLNTPSDFSSHENTLTQELLILNSSMVRYYSGDINNMNLEEIFNMLFLKFSRLYKYRITFIPEWLNPELKAEIESYDKMYSRGFRYTYKIYEEDPPDFRILISKIEYDTFAGNKFMEIINLCEEKEIKYLVVNNPHYYKYIGYNYTNQLFKQLPKENYVNFNNLNSTFCNNKFYNDVLHLNLYGALIYTNLVAKKFKAILSH